MCRSMLTPRTCSSSERWPPASPSRLIRLRWNLPLVARALTVVWSGQSLHRLVRLSPVAADLQSGGRICELYRARCIRVDPTAATIDRSVGADSRRAGTTSRSTLHHGVGRGVAHLTIFVPALALYFIVLPRFYGFSTLGQPLQIFALASLFTWRQASWARRLARGSSIRRRRH